MNEQAVAKTLEQRPGKALERVTPGNFPQVRQERMPMQELRELGEVFYAAGYFPDIKNVAQAIVKIKAGEELGFSPFVSMGGIHIIQGKASLGATLQASLIKNSTRYRYQTIKLDNTECILEFFEKIGTEWKSLGRSSFSMDDAKAANLLKTGNEKGMYEKYGRNMLFSRALTNGMRWHTPDLLRSADGNTEVVDNFDVDEVIDDTASQGHVEGELVEERTVEPVVEQTVTEDPELVELRTKVYDRVMEITGGEEIELKKLLKGRDPAVMPKDTLAKFLTELNGL